MKRFKSVDDYIQSHDEFRPLLEKLRSLISTTELKETVKWGMPVYTINGKNVVGISAFKNYAGLWFYQGALMGDKKKLLMNAQEGKTKAMRQLRFSGINEIDDKVILQYLDEAIKNEKAGKRVAVDRNKPLEIPEALRAALKANSKAGKVFEAFTLGKKREYAEYISSAKREATVLSRLEKILPMIVNGIGLNDKYK